MDEEAYRDLTSAIIERAVLDWRDLCNGSDMFRAYGRNGQVVSFDELRKFFKSEWCSLLCGTADPKYILKKLEQELVDSRVQREGLARAPVPVETAKGGAPK